jgi:hypothetical protein
MAVKMTAVVNSLGPQPQVVELGSYLGAGSTTMLLAGCPDMQLVSVDSFALVGPNCPPRWRPNGNTPFFRGQGTMWQHFVNNTWEWRDRVVPIAAITEPPCLQLIHQHLPDVAAVYLDADHDHLPVKRQLLTCRALWPQAVLMLDDYCDVWPGVKAAVADLVGDGRLQLSTFHEVVDGRLLVIDPRGQV